MECLICLGSLAKARAGSVVRPCQTTGCKALVHHACWTTHYDFHAAIRCACGATMTNDVDETDRVNVRPYRTPPGVWLRWMWIKMTFIVAMALAWAAISSVQRLPLGHIVFAVTVVDIALTLATHVSLCIYYGGGDRIPTQ